MHILMPFRLNRNYIRIFILQVLGSFCQSLAFNYGLHYAATIGPAYQSFLTTACWCLMTTILLLFSYVFSEKSSILVRQSLFVSRNYQSLLGTDAITFLLLLQETVFNAVACFSYLSSCSYLGFSVNTFLYPLYIVTPYFQVYPAMSAAYVSISILNKEDVFSLCI